jgi:pyruvoyl-dependent arginine decarboxylase (PvlArgDC)
MSAKSAKKRVKRYTERQIARVLNVYLKLGPDRSLRKTLEKLKALQAERRLEITPQLNTLQKWSAKYGWMRKAAEYDQEIASKVVTTLAAENAEVESVMRLLRENVVLGLQKMQEAIPSLDIEKAADLLHLANAVSRQMSVHESLRGSVTEKEDEQTNKAEEEFGTMHAEQIASSLKSIETALDPTQWPKH